MKIQEYIKLSENRASARAGNQTPTATEYAISGKERESFSNSPTSSPQVSRQINFTDSFVGSVDGLVEEYPGSFSFSSHSSILVPTPISLGDQHKQLLIIPTNFFLELCPFLLRE
jgi:hypothetical protein